MDERRPKRRRELSPKELKALEKQRKKQQELNRKNDKKAAKYREEARKQARKAGSAHINLEQPRNTERREPDRAVDYSRRIGQERMRDAENRKIRVQNIEVEGEQRLEGARRRSAIMQDSNEKRRAKNAQKRGGTTRRSDDKKARNAYNQETKRRANKKTLPDIIEKETDKRVRNLEASDHKDGFYADEVAVRKEQAKKQRRERRKKMPKPISPRKRRIRRITAYVSIIAIVLTVGIVLSLTVLFKSENIYVKGNKYYPNDTIIRLAKVREGDNIFIASMFGDSDAVSGSLPYVKAASINFQLPDSIVINIENATASYSLKTGGLYYLVSEDNILLEQTAKKPKGLASMVAPELKSTKIGDKVEFKDKRYTKALDDLLECIQKNNYKKVTEINVKKISDISITYDNRIKIRLGTPEAIDYKLRTAFAIINEKLDPNKTGKIKGVLNVSNCNKTKKSYFKEGSIKDTKEDETQPTASTTEETSVRTTYVAPITEAVTEAQYDFDDRTDYDNDDSEDEDNYDDGSDENDDEDSGDYNDDGGEYSDE